MPAPVIYPGARSFFGIGKEATSGTAVAAVRYIPWMKFDPIDDPHLLIDEGLRGSMVKEYGVALGKLWATGSFEGAQFDDYVGDLALNGLGDYTATATAAAPNSTLNGAVTAGATSVVVTSGTGFAANMWIQIGPDTAGGAEIVQIQSVSTNTLTLQAATPLRFNHATLSAVTNTTGNSTHVFSTLNTGTAQPPTDSIIDYTGMTPTVGARAYPFSCVEELTIEGNAEQLMKVTGKVISFASAPTAATPVNAPTAELVQPAWLSTVSIGGTPLQNISQWAFTLKRELIVKNTASGAQAPYVIGRGAVTVEGKLTFVAADESPLTTYLAGTQQPIVFTIDNGLAAAAHRNLTLTMTKGFYKKNQLKRETLFGWETEFGALGNTTDTGFSAGFSPCKISLLNAVNTY